MLKRISFNTWTGRRQFLPSIGGLELGDTHILGVALGILVRRTVETGHLVAQDTIVVDAEDSSTGGKLRVEGEGGGVAVVIERSRDGLMTANSEKADEY